MAYVYFLIHISLYCLHTSSLIIFTLDVVTTWIGTVNAGRDRMLTDSDKFSISLLLKEMGCIPIFASQELIDRAYLGFCKQQLWPSFHNVDLLDLTHACWNGDACISNPELSWDQSSVCLSFLHLYFISFFQIRWF